jgi:hypothetical protein
MGSFSDYWEDEVLDHLFGKGDYAPPMIYVGLSKGNPGDDGADLREPTGNGYTRVPTTEADWNIAAGGVLDNANTITFPSATGNWGTLTHFALFDSASAGHLLAHGALAQARTISGGDVVTFAANHISVTLD